ncbi:hypothetical protein C8A03DRAFT_46782 [Achaetomium macrosporum]|uniref:DUF7587 domain-containing protein n=1 Tax=Achaetomium macrosporum TaxID=79813 RepID=A0AAN7H4T1_9PEZI|nr:hypothetical protein C8A03DRAFT_46782 [Achaetomium macrosporum]
MTTCGLGIHLAIRIAQTCRDHLNWNSRRPGPFISMCTNWNKALARRSQYLDQGATSVVIVAVWLKGLSAVYDAYDLAASLGIPDSNRDWHLHEVLVLGGIWADQYRILVRFDGVGEPERALLLFDRFAARPRIPPAFIEGLPKRIELGMAPLPYATNRLRDAIYSNTGTRDDVKFYELVISIIVLNLGLLLIYSSAGGNQP